MLLRFRVANVRSLRDEQELSFVVPEAASEREESTAARRLPLSDGKQLPVYPVLGIFGANASGKSNVITALKKMREAVLSSYAAWTSHEGIERDEFALDPKAAEESTFYEVDLVLEDGVRGTYGSSRTPGGGRLLEPGQLWLTEKDERGATELFPISDWEPTDHEDLMASYLAGSFGAVPKVCEGQIGRQLMHTV